MLKQPILSGFLQLMLSLGLHQSQRVRQRGRLGHAGAAARALRHGVHRACLRRGFWTLTDTLQQLLNGFRVTQDGVGASHAVVLCDGLFLQPARRCYAAPRKTRPIGIRAFL